MKDMEKDKRQKVVVAMSPKKSLRDLTGQAGGFEKRVFVAMSGGVDSSVAAALLSGYAGSREARKKQGYDIAGVFMRFWADGKNTNGCCSVEAEAAARLVAAKLEIPFYVWDFAKEFKKRVVDYFLRELRAGGTPNPCAICNPQIKFGLFLDKARALGADFIATGHYARVVVIPSRARNLSRMRDEGFKQVERSFATAQDDDLEYKLFAAKNRQKDQSYFLSGLNQRQLSRVIFPLGDYKKSEVVRLAQKWRLPYRRGESFDICFIDDYQRFLKKHIKMRPGKIVGIFNPSQPPLGLGGGKILPSPPFIKEGATSSLNLRRGEELLGQHRGLPLYTIGQRAGVGGPGPFYVVGKNIKANELIVSNKAKDLLRQELSVKGVNWLPGKPPKLPLSCEVRIRYQSKAAPAIINQQSSINNHQLRVKFISPQRAITPGQSAVFYGKNGQVLGGGVILG